MQTTAPKIIPHVTQTIFSLARHAGGCRAYGTEYYYHPLKDALIRKDLLGEFRKAKSWGEFVEGVKNKENVK